MPDQSQEVWPYYIIQTTGKSRPGFDPFLAYPKALKEFKTWLANQFQCMPATSLLPHKINYYKYGENLDPFLACPEALVEFKTWLAIS